MDTSADAPSPHTPTAAEVAQRGRSPSPPAPALDASPGDAQLPPADPQSRNRAEARYATESSMIISNRSANIGSREKNGQRSSDSNRSGEPQQGTVTNPATNVKVIKLGIGNENTSILDLFPILGTSRGGRPKIDWETERETGLAIRPEESLFDLVQKSSRLTELIMGGKSIAAALGLLHSDTRMLDSETVARRSMPPLECKMYEAWKNGATLPHPSTFASTAGTATGPTVFRRQQRCFDVAPAQKHRLTALCQLYKLSADESFSIEQLQSFESLWPQLQPLIQARCRVIAMDNDESVLQSDRVRAECLALRKTINMMDGALNDIVAMIATAVQTVNETSELLRARLEALNATSPLAEATPADNFTHPSHLPTHIRSAAQIQQHKRNSDAPSRSAIVNNDASRNFRSHQNEGREASHMTPDSGLEIDDEQMHEDRDSVDGERLSGDIGNAATNERLAHDAGSSNADFEGLDEHKDDADTFDREQVEELLSESHSPEAEMQLDWVGDHRGRALLHPRGETQAGDSLRTPIDITPDAPQSGNESHSPESPANGQRTRSQPRKAGNLELHKQPNIWALSVAGDSTSSGGKSDSTTVGLPLAARQTDSSGTGNEAGLSAADTGAAALNGAKTSFLPSSALPFGPAGKSGSGSTPFNVFRERGQKDN